MISGASAYAMDPVKTMAEFDAAKATQANTLPQTDAKKQDDLNNQLRVSVISPKRDLARVKSLLAQGADVNCDKNLLIAAASWGDVEIAAELIKQGASVHFYNEGCSALHCALLSKPYLKEMKPLINCPKQDWESRRHHYYPKMVELLLKNGVACCAQNKVGMHPFKWVAQRSPASFGDLYKAFLRNRMFCINRHQHDSDYADTIQKAFERIVDTICSEKYLQIRMARAENNSSKKSMIKAPATTDPQLMYDALCAGADMVPGPVVVQSIVSKEKDAFESDDEQEASRVLKGPYKKIIDLAHCSIDAGAEPLAMFEQFQEEHKQAIKGSLPKTFLDSLYPLIFECLYIRPEVGIMPTHVRNLLLDPKDDRAIKLIETYFDMGGDVNATDMPIAVENKTQGESTALTITQKAVKSKRLVNSPLSLAIKSGNSKLVKLLERQGARLPGNQKYESCEKWLLAKNAGHAEIAEIYEVSMINAMKSIVRIEKIEEFADLLGRGVPVNLASKIDNKNLLLVLLDTTRPEVAESNPIFLMKVKLLIAHGINLNQKRAFRPRTALQLAAENHLVDVVKLLLYMGAQDNHPYPDGKLIWETTEHEGIKQLLKSPSEISIYLTDEELKEFAEIKAKRDAALEKMKAHNNTAAAV